MYFQKYFLLAFFRVEFVIGNKIFTNIYNDWSKNNNLLVSSKLFIISLSVYLILKNIAFLSYFKNINLNLLKFRIK